MLTAIWTKLRLRLRAEHGFTLAELSVSMAAGVVVIGALFTIMIVSLRQTQRTFTKVDATRRTRTTLSNIENELHSACVDGSPPIQGVTNGIVQTDANNLVFISSYGTSASPVPVWHQITFNASTATLTDATYAVTGTSPDWGQGALATTTTLLTNVAQLSSTIPVFQYYKYQPEYTDAGLNQYLMIPDGSNTVPISGATPNQPLATSSGLSAADGDTTVEVVINLLVGASAGTDHSTTLQSVSDPVTDTVSLRLTTPPDYAAAGTTPQGYGPCQ
jgi:Tfp pilus assembly protein PilW